MKKGSSSMQGQREREEEALCWGISSVRITLSSRRVIDTSAASGGPEGKTTPPSSPHSLPCIHPSLLPAPHPSVRCFLSSAGSSAACPGADSDGERPRTSQTPGRKRRRRRWRSGTVRDSGSRPSITASHRTGNGNKIYYCSKL